MTEQDRALARRALERRRLSSGQVELLLEEARRTGRSFRDLAIGRGLLSAEDFRPIPPRQVPLPVLLLLGAGLTIFAVAVVVSTMDRSSAAPVPDRTPSLRGSK